MLLEMSNIKSIFLLRYNWHTALVWFVICIYCKMVTTITVVIICHHGYKKCFFLVRRTCKIFLSNLQICKSVLIAVNRLYITSTMFFPIALQCRWKSESLMSPALYFLLDCFGYLGSFVVTDKLQVFFFLYFCEKCHWVFDRNSLNL